MRLEGVLTVSYKVDCCLKPSTVEGVEVSG